mmetsp:Transcript_31073/g.82676  ORF Transcript_31073/g.82676 Transcript_31073/m.82676 type:complete len:355 (-) Transcript_31073:183-1247(-)
MRAGGEGAGSGHASSSSIRRIHAELREINESPSRHWTAGPAGDDLYEWQFAVRGPPGTDFEGGIYTGRIALPTNYPLSPPSVMLLTPNGRWEVGKKICLSNSNYHPELWQPAWGIRTMIEALRAHFPAPGDGAIGALDWPSDIRKRLAKESLDFVCPLVSRRNREMLPELTPEELTEECTEEQVSASVANIAAAAVETAETPETGMGEANRPVDITPSVQAVAGPTESPVADGLRQRRGGETASPAPSPAPSPTQSQSPFAIDPEIPSESSGVTIGVGSSTTASPPPRRRREGPRTQRRQQKPLFVQIFKPPETKRGCLLLVVDLMIVLMTISSFFVVKEIVQNPQFLFEPMSE